MNILITGSSGFLGRELCDLLKNKNVNLNHLNRKKSHFKDTITINLNNINNLKKLKNLLKSINPDVIINLAAIVDFRKKIKDIKVINSILPYRLGKYCYKYNKYLIHISSVSVHGTKNLYSNRTKYHPRNNYSKSKLQGDKHIIKSKCKYSILRFGGIYGNEGPDHLIINNFMNKKKQTKKIFSGNLHSRRNYIYVKDAAKIICNCLTRKNMGILYFGGEKNSFKEMIKEINKYLDDSNDIKIKNSKSKQYDQIIKNSFKYKKSTFKSSLKEIMCK